MSTQRKRGTAPLKANEETVIYSLRLTEAQREKIGTHGGAKWVRKLIDRARVA